MLLKYWRFRLLLRERWEWLRRRKTIRIDRKCLSIARENERPSWSENEKESGRKESGREIKAEEASYTAINSIIYSDVNGKITISALITFVHFHWYKKQKRYSHIQCNAVVKNLTLKIVRWDMFGLWLIRRKATRKPKSFKHSHPFRLNALHHAYECVGKNTFQRM